MERESSFHLTRYFKLQLLIYFRFRINKNDLIFKDISFSNKREYYPDFKDNLCENKDPVYEKNIKQ